MGENAAHGSAGGQAKKREAKRLPVGTIIESRRDGGARYFWGGAGNFTYGPFGSCPGGTKAGASRPAGPSERT